MSYSSQDDCLVFLTYKRLNFCFVLFWFSFCFFGGQALHGPLCGRYSSSVRRVLVLSLVERQMVCPCLWFWSGTCCFHKWDFFFTAHMWPDTVFIIIYLSRSRPLNTDRSKSYFYSGEKSRFFSWPMLIKDNSLAHMSFSSGGRVWVPFWTFCSTEALFEDGDQQVFKICLQVLFGETYLIVTLALNI